MRGLVVIVIGACDTHTHNTHTHTCIQAQAHAFNTALRTSEDTCLYDHVRVMSYACVRVQAQVCARATCVCVCVCVCVCTHSFYTVT